MRPIRAVLRIVAAAGLAVDAYVHADLAGQFDGNGTHLTEGTLFRAQAALAALAALWVLLSGRRLSAAFALLISASALGALLLYRYVDVGALGPLPNMYEPIWYTEKTVAAIAEGVAVVASAALLVVQLVSPGPGAGIVGRSARLPKGPASAWLEAHGPGRRTGEWHDGQGGGIRHHRGERGGRQGGRDAA